MQRLPRYSAGLVWENEAELRSPQASINRACKLESFKPVDAVVVRITLTTA